MVTSSSNGGSRMNVCLHITPRQSKPADMISGPKTQGILIDIMFFSLFSACNDLRLDEYESLGFNLCVEVAKVCDFPPVV